MRVQGSVMRGSFSLVPSRVARDVRWLRMTAFVSSAAVAAGLVAAADPVAAVAVPAAGQAAAVAAVGAPDTASAMLTARVRGVRVEDLSQRSEIATVFVNPDGSFTAEQFGAPVRVRDKAGKDGWRDVDLTLEARADGSVAPRVHPGGLVLAGKSAAGGVLKRPRFSAALIRVAALG